MQLRHLFVILIILSLLLVFVTIPNTHRFFLNHNNNNNQNNIAISDKISLKTKQNSKPTTTAESSSKEEQEREDSSSSSSQKPTQFPKIIPEQMDPTEIAPKDLSGEFQNPYKPLIEDESFLESKGFKEAKEKLRLASRHEQDDEKNHHKKCSMLKYTQGKWVRRSQPPRLMYPSLGEILGCCERGFVRDKKIWKEEQNQNQPHINNSSSGSGSSISSTSSSAALVVNNHLENEFREELYYEWVPNDCDLIPWSEELFCKALRGRDIMFAGDSLNDHWHASLYYLLGGRKDMYKYEGTIGGKKRCKGHPICGKYYKKPLKLHHLTNQYLTESSLRNRNYKWWKPIRKYPILVLNSGSWMRDVFDERIAISDEKWKSLMMKALGLVHREEYNGTIIWRTTYSGHPFCWDYKKPLDKPLEKEDFPNVHPYNKYRWETIPERNKFTTNLWKKAGAHILDVERITGMMPLGHLGKNHPKYAVTRNATDCLHYCSPGPVYDTWSQLLMNLLLGNFED